MRRVAHISALLKPLSWSESEPGYSFIQRPCRVGLGSSHFPITRNLSLVKCRQFSLLGLTRGSLGSFRRPAVVREGSCEEINSDHNRRPTMVRLSAVQGLERTLPVNGTVANCCQIVPIFPCPKGSKGFLRDDARTHNWQ